MTFRSYVEAGWALCEFEPGTKGPAGPAAVGWNTRERAITDPQRVNGMVQGGLLHAYSATCSIDVDNLPVAREFLAARGVDLDALLAAPDSVQISSGRPNRAKLIYRLPTPLASKKLGAYEVVDLATGEPKTYHALELRCATRGGKSVQDVLPPSVHPGTGRPYEWKYGNALVGDWRYLPDIPQALLALWQEGHVRTTQEPAQPALATAWPHELTAKDIAELRSYLAYHTSDAYDDWVDVGMALHDATGGSPEGLLLWDEWSRQFPRYGESKGGLPPQYPSDKWPSFTSGRPGNKTIGYLKSKAPAALESFPVVAAAEEFSQPKPGTEPDFGNDTRPGTLIRRALAPLVFVTSQGTYYDRNRGVLLNRDSIDDLYTHLMPTIHTTGPNGAAKTIKPKPRDELRQAAWKEVVDGVGMHPGEGAFFVEHDRRYLNTYQKSNIEPLAPTGDERAAFEFMWSRPDEKVFRDWLMKFFAHALQKPGVKIRSAPLIVGHTTGSGKSTLMRVLPELLFTPRYVTTITSEGLREQFNDQLARAWWVHFEEMHSGNSKGERVSVFNKVKPWITESIISIRPMYGSRYDAPNRVQPTAASNYEDDALHVDDADRRWGVGHIDKKMSALEADDLYKFLESPRAPGVLHHIFRGVSLDGFNPNAPAPDTAAKRIMVSVNYGMWESKVLELMEAGTPPFDKDLFTAQDVMLYLSGGMTANRLGRILTRMPFNCEQFAPAYSTRLWAWKNQALWAEMGPAARAEHHSSGARPHGHVWDTGLPASILAAVGAPPAEPRRDLLA